ncbi:MAG TPA: HlyD family secretion protein [Steroidobacteraceae bacterium]|jgi:membrane fusion protein, multidrug efflux system|nr:HlyD family secretion protein [Steroidobacteraceae bacterium]
MSSDPPPPGAPQQTPAGAAAPRRKPLNPKVRRGLLIGGAVLTVVGLIFGIRWLFFGRFMISTDDAYLRADAVTIAPRVSGYIDEIYVKENQHVAAGTPLLHIDKRNYQDTLSQQSASVAARRADLDAVDSQMKQQGAVIAQGRAQVQSARVKAKFAREQAERYRSLSDQGADTEEKSAQFAAELAQDNAAEAAANANLRAAESQLGVLKSQREQAEAQLKAAQAQVSSAQQNLDDTVIKASVEGTVGDNSARVGQFVQPGTRMMSIVPLQSVYLVANFKETQIKRMRIGQKASFKVDAIGGKAIEAEVESFAPGTGSQFALLPPENATGNFIKIVQRVPVRLHVLAPKDLSDRLLPGLSVIVTVDTTREGPRS